MAWIYLAESVESVWPLHHGSDQSPIVRETDTLKLFCCLGCGQVNLRPPEYGTTLPRSYLACCPEMKLISSTADSPARISALQELVAAWEASGQDYFSKSYDYVAIFDRDSFSWKTSQLSLFGGLTEFSWSSLRWGSIVDGRLYQPRNLEPHIYENDGSYLPTPTASQAGTNGKTWCKKTQSWINGIPSLTMMANQNRIPTPKARDWKGSGGANRESPDLPRTMGGSLNPQFVEEIMGYSIGWTALEAWAMQWFRSKRVKRSKDSVELELR